MKGGWCRFNLHYTLTEFDLWYLKEVLSFVVLHGARFLSLYNFNAMSDVFTFDPPDDFGLQLESATDGENQKFGLAGGFESHEVTDEESRQKLMKMQLQNAKQIVLKLPAASDLSLGPLPGPVSEYNKMKFVVVPSRVTNLDVYLAALVRQQQQAKKGTPEKLRAIAAMGENCDERPPNSGCRNFCKMLLRKG